jgi:hypothetical protein
MSFSTAIDASYFLAPGEFRRHTPRRGAPPPRSRARETSDHPVLFMGGLLFALSATVIILWPAMGLLLPL